MTEMQLRSKVTEQARSWLDASEANGKWWPIVEVYNDYAQQHGGYIMTKSDPWCAAFVSAVFIAAGVPQIIPIEVSCPRMVTEAERRGLWIEDDNYLPAPGDLILYDWSDSGIGDDRGNPGHVGVVSTVSGSTIIVIEGNSSDAVRRITRERNQRYIRGYIVPDYKSAASDEDEPQPEPSGDKCPPAQYHDYRYYVLTNLLKIGDQGPQVLNMQFLLAAHGFYSGKLDGVFGNSTYTALRDFQKAAGISIDGEWGGESFKAMWNYGK